VQVLIVDDDQDLGHAICETLELQGHDVHCVSNGREALEHLRGGRPTCLILLDLMMPVMNGWEFREKQLADRSLARIPVVVVTADRDARQKADDLSAAGFLQKPVRADDLIRCVGEHCSGS
jgi:CheY-like chemotaxis protein